MRADKVWNGGWTLDRLKIVGTRLSDCAASAAKAKSPAVQRDYRELAYEWDVMAEQIEMLRRDSQKPAA